ncbi:MULTISPECIES: MucB/RseB C-terminal domain-containing protein [Pseudomonas]|jgi:sigma-E factor negative regulatory protein RseB|uniref:MucB/RseB C-terminal domain-containing protein n=1 Tax=Serpens gallinarum TaxID=2763075 RepID=A0ABR8TLD1_9PSED|nr:MucB/RseB C-terminal domain-containing protein [Serpens gallinarum]MBD7976273.1 MucB/RseB C-terminal domain-containing protein [Serpens gallinarum]
MRFLSFALGVSALLGQSAWADAQDWLLRLQAAEQQTGFHGAFVYERNGSFSSHEIWRHVASNSVQERMLQLDGPAHETLRTNGRLTCMNGSLVSPLIEERWSVRNLDTRQLNQWYEMRVAGNSRVAGRAAVVLALIPRDQHRYGFELHLDRETALPLKSLLLNEKGQPLERFQYVEFQEGASLAMVQPSQQCEPVEVRDSRQLSEKSWRSDWLPAGFVLNQIVEQRASAEAAPVAWLMYGDGLARFSIFLEPLGDAQIADVRSQLGPTATVSRRLSTANGDLMVTVVGEIPVGTAERIALSMRSESGNSSQ